MKQTPSDISRLLLSDTQPVLREQYTSFAPANIALCKYWGKRNSLLNLPVNDSLSISLGDQGTHTMVTPVAEAAGDTVTLNNQPVDPSAEFYLRVTRHIDLFRHVFGLQYFHIATSNSIPTAAGLASSASGFAALTKALIGIYSLNLSEEKISILARLGSGSACRSTFNGFVHWHKGHHAEGHDSFATPLPYPWPELRIGIIRVSSGIKTVSSREGMHRTVNTSHLYPVWKHQAANDMKFLLQAIEKKDFNLLGTTSEHNAMTMHATMLSSWPPLLYWSSETLKTIQHIWRLRQEGLDIYMTIDAGPNIKVLFEKKNEESVKQSIRNISIIKPFTESTICNC